MGSQQRYRGNVTAMKADSEFLGAEDVMGQKNVRVRIVDVLTYPAGHVVAGREATKPFPVLVLERWKNPKGLWEPCKKRWIVSGTEVRRSIITRAESVHAAHWQGVELGLSAKVVRSHQGGLTWGIRVVLTADECDREKLAEKMQRAADRTTEGDGFRVRPTDDEVKNRKIKEETS